MAFDSALRVSWGHESINKLPSQVAHYRRVIYLGIRSKCDTICRVWREQYRFWHLAEPVKPLMNDPTNCTNCQTPSCATTPDYSYSEEYKLKCLARTYGYYSADQRDKYLFALKKQKGWEQQLNDLESLIVKLKAEGRYETEFWKADARLNASK